MAAAMLFSLQGIHAQTDVTEETDSDDIITVTDKDGKQEEIEVPEGLEDNLDSLLHLYNAQTYMMADTTCKYRDVTLSSRRKCISTAWRECLPSSKCHTMR